MFWKLPYLHGKKAFVITNTKQHKNIFKYFSFQRYYNFEILGLAPLFTIFKPKYLQSNYILYKRIYSYILSLNFFSWNGRHGFCVL